MTSPYENRPLESFWKTGVTDQHPRTIKGLYEKRYPITRDLKIATAGSCFAQHISRQLRARRFKVLDTEPAPKGLPADVAAKWGYGLYSARYGNIYLARQLRQLAEEAFGHFVPADAVWEKNGRFYDALRPSVEPNGLESPEAVAMHRQSHLRHVRRLFQEADVFVFTFGLTEGWIHKESGTVYPTAPGTIAGCFDADVHAFKNFGFDVTLMDFIKFRSLVKEHNPNLKFLVTVSPVPLTATASDQHVLVATTYSKSILRAVAGELYQQFSDVDYFPSYELIATPFARARFYAPNLRSVTDDGVDVVMRVFFRAHGIAAGQAPSAAEVPDGATDVKSHEPMPRRPAQKTNVVCEDELLEAFSR